MARVLLTATKLKAKSHSELLKCSCCVERLSLLQVLHIPWLGHTSTRYIPRFPRRKQHPGRLTQDLQDKPLAQGCQGHSHHAEWGCTYARRRRGPAGLSQGAGSRRACTARSCVPWCCAGTHHTLPRWCSPSSCTQPCQSGTGWSGHCSCTL